MSSTVLSSPGSNKAKWTASTRSPIRGISFRLRGFEVGFGIWEGEHGMVDHQEILSAVAITHHGSHTCDIQKLDRHAARSSGPVLLHGSLRVREPDDGAEDAAWL